MKGRVEDVLSFRRELGKKALIGKLVIVAIIVILVMGVTVYFTFTKTGLSIKTGDVKFSVDYEPEDNLKGKIVEIDEDGIMIEEPQDKYSGETTEENRESHQEEFEDIANRNTGSEEELNADSNETEGNNSLIDE
jgi:hypothetical protein